MMNQAKRHSPSTGSAWEPGTLPITESSGAGSWLCKLDSEGGCRVQAQRLQTSWCTLHGRHVYMTTKQCLQAWRESLVCAALLWLLFVLGALTSTKDCVACTNTHQQVKQ